MGNTVTALTEAVYYILLSLVEPRHGYAIMQHVEAMSGGRLRISAGTMYGALSGLIEKGWIEPLECDGESRKKEYRITSSGRDALAGELERLRELVANGAAVLGDGSGSRESGLKGLEPGGSDRESQNRGSRNGVNRDE